MCVCVCVCVCVCTHVCDHISFIHSHVNRHLGCFHVLAIANNAAMNIWVHVSFRIRDFFRYMPIIKEETKQPNQKYFLDICPGVGSLGHMAVLFLVFLWNLHTLLHGSCTNSHHQFMRVAFSLHPQLHLLFVFSLITVIIAGVRWYLILVLISISLAINHVKHLFMCLLASGISFLEKCLFRSAHFLTSCFLMLSCISCLCILDIGSHCLYNLQIFFSHSVYHLFILSIVSFAVQKLSILIKFHLFSFAFISFALWDRYKKTLL